MTCYVGECELVVKVRDGKCVGQLIEPNVSCSVTMIIPGEQ